MAVTPLPFLDRTAATFKTDVDAFFAQKLPQFSVEVNQVLTDAQSSATAANSSKTAAATSATNAATSATNAGNSATAANTSKTNAATSETNAAASATAANTSKNAAAGSATAAATSATNSEASAVRAKAAADSIASGPVTSVNGKTGAPVLTKTDLGLSLVDNISMYSKGLLPPTGGLLPSITNIDEFVTLTNGWYAVSGASTGGTAGTKPPGEAWGTLFVIGRAFQADARVTQMFFSESGDRIWWRRNSSGNWGDWQLLSFPALSTSVARRPLTPGGDGLTLGWGDTLSIPKYLDKMFTGPGTGTCIINLSTASVWDFTLTGNASFSITNMPTLSGESLTLIIRIRQNASPKTVTWFSGITWLTVGGAVPPTPAANQIVEYILSTSGDGSSWVGRVGAST
jgi:hypothetical protein